MVRPDVRRPRQAREPDRGRGQLRDRRQRPLRERRHPEPALVSPLSTSATPRSRSWSSPPSSGGTGGPRRGRPLRGRRRDVEERMAGLRGPAGTGDDPPSRAGGRRTGRRTGAVPLPAGSDDWWWQVDDVFLGEPTCAPVDGGLVVGNTRSTVTRRPLVGVEVSSSRSPLAATSVRTPEDQGEHRTGSTGCSPRVRVRQRVTATLDDHTEAFDPSAGAGGSQAVRQDLGLQADRCRRCRTASPWRSGRGRSPSAG